jgi:pimeloyl-ACP methyl ester carboxylesterase
MQHIQLQHTSIAFESIRVEQNRNENVVLVFLHEALGSIGQWKAFPELLCKKLQLDGFVYERQGHGNSSPFSSDRTANYLHEYAWNELNELITTTFPADKKLILVGHSDGGSIALLYAARFSKNVLACITMAAHVINEPETIAGIQPAIDAFEAGKLIGLTKYHGDKTETLFFAWANTWKSQEFKHWTICKDIQSITCPVFALQGSGDQYGTEKQLDLIKTNVSMNVKTVIIPNCGHHPHLEQQELVLNEIKAFFTSEN